MGIPDEPFWSPPDVVAGVPRRTPPSAVPRATSAWQRRARRARRRRAGGVGRGVAAAPASKGWEDALPDVRAGREDRHPSGDRQGRSAPCVDRVPRAGRPAPPTSPATPAPSSPDAVQQTRRDARRPPGLLRRPRARRWARRWSAWPATAAILPGRRHVLRVPRLHAPAGAPGRRCRGPRSCSCSATTRSASARTARPTSRSSTWPRCGRSPACRSSARPTPTRRWRRGRRPSTTTARRRSCSAARASRCAPTARPSSAAPASSRDADGPPALVIVATGSEVAAGVDAAEQLADDGHRAPGSSACRAGTASPRQDADVPRRSCSRPACRCCRSRRRRRSAGSATPTTRSASTASASAHPAPWCSTSSASTSTTSSSAAPRARRPNAVRSCTWTDSIRLYEEFGQSPWLDNLKRGYLTSGQLRRAARRRHPRPDVEPDDLPEGDRRLGRLRRAVPRARRRRRPDHRRLLGAGAARHRRRLRRVRPGVRRRATAATASSASRSTPALAHDSAGHRGGRPRPARAHRPAQPDGEDPGDRRGRRADPGR